MKERPEWLTKSTVHDEHSEAESQFGQTRVDQPQGVASKKLMDTGKWRKRWWVLSELGLESVTYYIGPMPYCLLA